MRIDLDGAPARLAGLVLALTACHGEPWDHDNVSASGSGAGLTTSSTDAESEGSGAASTTSTSTSSSSSSSSTSSSSPSSSSSTSTSTSTSTTDGPTSSGTPDDSTTEALPPPCECFAGDGPYCGAAVVDHAAEFGCEVPILPGHEDDLLKCVDGAWKVKAACSDGCVPTTPGESDACALPVCPCFVQVAWCGSGAAAHGLTLDPPCQVPLVPKHANDILACDGDQWIVKEKCPDGCHENAMGVPDTCNDDSLYLLPWACGVHYTCSQANFGSSHQGSQAYAWDFALPKGSKVHAARAGVVAYLEVRSPPGSTCYDPPGLLEACHNKANFIGVRHNDGTVALYMHLSSMKVKKGDVVTQGQLIALSGNSGYTSGPHLHFQLQNECGIWFCQSIPVSFADAPGLAKGKSVASGNCP